MSARHNHTGEYEKCIACQEEKAEMQRIAKRAADRERGIFHDSPNIVEITVESARTMPHPYLIYGSYRIAASVTAKTNPDVFTADFLRLQEIVETALDTQNESVLKRLREENDNAEKVF